MSDMNQTNDFEDAPPKNESDHQPELAVKSPPGAPLAASHKVGRPRSVWLLGLSALLPLAVSVAFGASKHNAQDRQVMRTTEQHRDFAPDVRIARVRAAGIFITFSLPATSLAFASANIFSRTNGYI